MIDCVHLGPSSQCGLLGQTTDFFCSRCHLRQARGAKSVFEYLPQEVIARINPVIPPAEIKTSSSTPFLNKDRIPLDLRTLYAGRELFLVLSGPSFKKVDQDLLRRRGVITMGINNSAASFRPHLWTHVDPPHKFHHGIWLDPGILKFMSERFYMDRLRTKEDGEFKHQEDYYKDLPGVIGYQRNASFNPKTFLSESTVNFGNSSRWNEAKKKGNPRHNLHPHVINVMFTALKIPYSLGFRKVILLGADFNMPATGDIYSFVSEKDEAARTSNNLAYLKLNLMLQDLRKPFEEAGYHVYNATVGSHMMAFPFVDLKEAIHDATKSIPETPWDTSRWYAGADRVKPPRSRIKAR